MNDLRELAITGLAWLILAVPAGLVCLALWRTLPADARRLLPWPRWRSAPWTGIDVWVAFLPMYLSALPLFQLLNASGLFIVLYGEGGKEASLDERKLLWVDAAVRCVTAMAVLVWFCVIRQVPASQLGLTARRAGPNIIVGYLAWLVLTLPILLMYGLITQILQRQPHLLERLAKGHLLAAEWVLIVFVAMLAAPLVEELIFRGILLPWQISSPLNAQLVVPVAAFGISVLLGFDKEGNFHPGSMLFVLAMLPGYLLIPYFNRRLNRRRTRGAGGSEAGADLPQGEADMAGTSVDLFPPWLVRLHRRFALPAVLPAEKQINLWVAIYSNALFFAACHAVWPSPVPLFPLSIGLAWLAYRTRSLVAPVVTHVLFNGVGTLTLFLG